jgi:hypothetical protein
LSTPDIFGHYHSGDVSTDPYLADNDNNVTTMLNYFNAEDWALDLWEQNNVMKPSDWTPYLFGYYGRETQYQEGTDRFYRGPIDTPRQIFSVAVQRERHQIFAYSAESQSKALGQAENSEFTSWNLETELGYDGEHYSHSREFRSHLPEQWDFWAQLVADCLFDTTLP